MSEKFNPQSFKACTNNIGSLFFHVDNVRYVYDKEHIECPAWYLEKYDKHLNKFY